MLTIQPCKFTNYPNGNTTYGYRCYDSYGSSYDNTWDEEDIKKPPLEILKKAVDLCDDNLRDALSFVIERGESIEVRGVILDWELIENMLKGM